MDKILFSNKLLKWYDGNQRILPWRDNTEAYRVWISEIMLQQTRVTAVIPFFNRFINELPTIESLANVEDDKLMKLWEGLGYYSRARNLKKAANVIMEKHNGVIPNTKKELESLPGIGPYTSGAILSIAFNQQDTAVDGNVLRVFARILDIQTDIKEIKVKTRIKELVTKLLPERVGDFNQALMEIGATVCLPSGTPKCEVCPLKEFCEANRNQTVHLIPLKRKRKQVPIETKTILILKYKDQVAVEKRPSTGLLAGLYQFPMLDGHINKEDIKKAFEDQMICMKELPKSKHVFSHKKWDMIGYQIELKEPFDWMLIDVNEVLEMYSIPTAFKTYKECIGEQTYE